MEQNYVIITDTDTDVTPEVAKELGYSGLISMPYIIDGKEIFPYEDFETFDAKAFYDTLRCGTLPKTGGISPERYIKYIEPHFKAGKDVLYVHFSGAMSGTFNAMRIAEAELKKAYPDRKLYTLDTKGITICSLGIVKEVGDMYLAGKSVGEILGWGETEVDKFATYFYADDLKFFGRSGRVSNFSATMGSILGIHPILTMSSDGMMKSVAKARGKYNTLRKILDYVVDLEENIKDHRVIIGHSDATEIADAMAKMLREKFGDGLKIEFVDVNPTAGSHCGPDCIGVCFHAKHR